MPRDQNGNEISDEDRINRNMARFLSTEKQQKQLLLCLRQQEMPKRLRMGKLTSMKVACKDFGITKGFTIGLRCRTIPEKGLKILYISVDLKKNRKLKFHDDCLSYQ